MHEVMKMKKNEKEEDEENDKILCLWFIVRYNGLVSSKGLFCFKIIKRLKLTVMD